MEFSSRKAVIMAMEEYTIRNGVDYWVYELEPLTFYAKCTQYGSGCDWLIRVSMIRRKYCCVIMRYNGSHTCTRATISQDHLKLDSNTIAEVIKPLVEFNYTINYRKAWLAKQKSVKKYSEVGKHRTKLCPYAVARNNRAWSPLKAFHMFCITHIESNFLRKFKTMYMQKLVINIGYLRMVCEYGMRYKHLRERGEAYTNWLS
ncbi:hypothetical protein Ahy_B01g052471 isoform A [Arachis hypogaea]|uniref:Uncharacterized protein n=1 Tax=Arachis hypogaea TaxID=3818 RepID=A0A445APK8_ARAHY|nr:hypothetical protein Ahy_B01g052471 isoform A [Arachis hypogaea]